MEQPIDRDKLKEIFKHYEDTYTVSEDIQTVMDELINNNVEVKGNSFYCEVEDNDTIALLAGTTDKADLWVLKKIIKLIKSGKEVHSMLNGNSEYLLKQLSRYNMRINNRIGDVSYMTFNPREGV